MIEKSAALKVLCRSTRRTSENETFDDRQKDLAPGGLVSIAACPGSLSRGTSAGRPKVVDDKDLYVHPPDLISGPPSASFIAGTQRKMADTEKKHPQPAPIPPTHPEQQPGAAWKDYETHVLPRNNIPIVFTAFSLCTFLAALDQVSLPLPSKFAGGKLSLAPLG